MNGTQANIRDEVDAALNDAAQRYFRDRYSFEDRRRLPAATRRFCADSWRELAEMGWLGLAVPEDRGGFGLRLSSVALLAETGGRVLLNEPFISTGVVAAYLIAQLGTEQQRADIEPLVQGDLLYAVGLGSEVGLPSEAKDLTVGPNGISGKLVVVQDADIAQKALVRATDQHGVHAYIIDLAAPGVSKKAYRLADGRGAATLEFVNAPAAQLGCVPADQETVAIQQACCLGALTSAADSLGAMSVAFDTTLDYLKTRVQFGRPIGTNQALQFRAVDMFLLLAEARAVIASAVDTYDIDSASFARSVHAAKAIVGRAARSLAQEAVQLHGGIGMTEEHIVSHCLRRVIVNESLFGTPADHFEWFALQDTQAAYSRQPTEAMP